MTKLQQSNEQSESTLTTITSKTSCNCSRHCKWLWIPVQKSWRKCLKKLRVFTSELISFIQYLVKEMKCQSEEGKQKVYKHYLTMFLKEAYALYLDSCVTDDERCSFTTFSNLQSTKESFVNEKLPFTLMQMPNPRKPFSKAGSYGLNLRQCIVGNCFVQYTSKQWLQEKWMWKYVWMVKTLSPQNV